VSRRVDLRGVLRAAAALVAGAAIVRLIDGFLGSIPAAGAVLGAFAVDLVAGRVGVRWSEEGKPPWARDLRLGATRGASAALVVVLVGIIAGWASVALGSPGPTLAFALARVFGESCRDVMLLIGIPITLGLRARVPASFLVAFAAAAAAAPLSLAEHADPAAIASAAAMAALGARLLLATRGVTAATAAHAAWLLALGPLSRGGLLDVVWRVGDPGPPPHAEGAIAWVGVAVVTAVAIFGVPGMPRQDDAPLKM